MKCSAVIDIAPPFRLVVVNAVDQIVRTTNKNIDLANNNKSLGLPVTNGTLEEWIDSSGVNTYPLKKISLIPHPKHRTILRPRGSAVVETCRRDIRVPKHFLNFGDVGFVHQRISCGRRA